MSTFDPTIHSVEAILQQHEARFDHDNRQQDKPAKQQRSPPDVASDQLEKTKAEADTTDGLPDGVGTQINMEV
ncbi:MAG: hypothetical protein KDB23_08535 [Planctomycetales bacterium]|nr:hypothetical protein [Planctomycetales bacterium]